jgi:hypothetical protein
MWMSQDIHGHHAHQRLVFNDENKGHGWKTRARHVSEAAAAPCGFVQVNKRGRPGSHGSQEPKTRLVGATEGSTYTLA